MAVFGHSGSHAPQLMHSSVISVDIFPTVLRTSRGTAAYAARVGVLPRFEPEEYRRTRTRASICRLLRGHRGDDASGELGKGGAGGVRWVFDHQWHALIAGLPQLGLNRNACEEVDMFLNRHGLAATAS